MKYSVKRHAVTQPPDASYRLIPLTRSQNAIVDVADFTWLSQWNWYAFWNPSTKSFYAMRAGGRVRMHRMILECSPKQDGDHINGNTLDNRRENLRKCSRTQNAQNRGKQVNNTSGYKGVHWSVTGWRSRIWVNGKCVHVGMFATSEQAAHAYDAAAKVYHGRFAKPNFP
jgi:hypothetical protein